MKNSVREKNEKHLRGLMMMVNEIKNEKIQKNEEKS